jgi:hypothetical protein
MASVEVTRTHALPQVVVGAVSITVHDRVTIGVQAVLIASLQATLFDLGTFCLETFFVIEPIPPTFVLECAPVLDHRKQLGTHRITRMGLRTVCRTRLETALIRIGQASRRVTTETKKIIIHLLFRVIFFRRWRSLNV